MKFNWPIIGHKNIVNFLQRSITNKKIVHAYLFYGPENLGKKTVAKYFALSLICERKEIDNVPCGKCQNCQKFFKNIHPDIIWLRKENDKKNISIDQIRDLKEKISLTSFTNSYKIVIIVNTEEMTGEAANSFLKILEEPPPKNVIILLANSLKNIPKTIISRCQLIKFSLVSKKEIFDFLIKKYKLNKKEAEEISALSFGRPGRAIKFLENKERLKNYLESQKKLIKIIKSNLNQRLKIVEEIIKEEKIKETILNWKVFFRDLVLLKTENNEFIINLSFKNKLDDLTKKFSFEKIIQIEKELDNFNFYIDQNINLKLALDNFVINL